VPGRSEVFLTQARLGAGRSPLYDRLWRQLAEEPLVDGLVERYEWDTPLKVAGGLHYLVLGGRASWDDVPRALVDEREFLRRYAAGQGVQTNEVQRSWMLLPCFLEAARRLSTDVVDVLELGPSAGLNLVWDRYRYRYANGSWGDRSAPLELAGDERTRVPAALLAQPLRVERRVGIDLAPIDLSDDDGVTLLRSFVWPDMTERLQRLDRAIEAVRSGPPPIVRGDVAERLPGLLAGTGPVLVFETNALVYVPREGRRRIAAALEEAATRRPVAFVRTTAEDEEQTYSSLELTILPGGEPEIVARADYHGAWLDWRV